MLRSCVDGQYQAVLGSALPAEYEDVLDRMNLFASSVLSEKERNEVFDAF